MISVSKAEGEATELQCTAEWPPDSREAIQLGERIHVQQNLQAICKGVSRSSDRQAAYATAARISSDSK